MVSLLLAVFLLQLTIHIVNTGGAPAINNILWTLWNKLPTPASADVQTTKQLKVEVLRLKRDLNATSAQDDFAKWAKLRRQHDKALAEHDEKAAALQSFKSQFDSAVSVLRWLGTNGLRFLVQFWFAKQPMLWLPKGWMPWYAEWILSFPRAPMGAVSIQIWGTACVTAIRMVGAAAVSTWVLAMQRGEGGVKKGERMKMGGRGGGGEKREKKEL